MRGNRSERGGRKGSAQAPSQLHQGGPPRETESGPAPWTLSETQGWERSQEHLCPRDPGMAFSPYSGKLSQGLFYFPKENDGAAPPTRDPKRKLSQAHSPLTGTRTRNCPRSLGGN